jgi:hypothetical protein
MDWHARSLDMNPIEQLWVALKRKLQLYPRAPTGLLELWECVYETFNFVTLAECNKVYESMPCRMKAVIYARANGLRIEWHIDIAIQN